MYKSIKTDIVTSFNKEDVQVRNYAPNINGLVLGLIPEERILEVFYEGLKIIETLGGRYWISAGTALGIWRDQKFIPHDTDIDVEVYGRWGKNTREFEVQLQTHFHDYGFILKRVQRYKGKLQQLAYVKNDVIFDIYFFYDGTGQNDLINFNEYGIYKFKKTFLPQGETDTIYGPLMMPHETDEYLAWRYGPDWRTPKDNKAGWSDDCACLEKL